MKMRIPSFDKKLFTQFIKECRFATAALIEFEQDGSVYDEVISYSNWYALDEIDVREPGPFANTAVIFETQDNKQIKVPFSSFMSHMKPSYDKSSYHINVVLEKDPPAKITFLYPKNK